jgi:peptide/nickel transport system substrate-binding protein
MMKSPKVRFTVALALGSILVVGALANIALAQDTGTTGATGTTASPSSGGGGEPVRFTWGSTGEPSSLNPMSGYLALDFYFWTASYHLLVDWDQQFGVDNSDGPGSGLADDITVSDDLMTFTYHIRDDVVWSDGQPLTANDVAYTLNLYKGNHAYLPQNYLTLIDGDVKVLDDYTVQWHTTEPTGLYSGKSAYMYDYILPEHVFSKIEKPKQYENVPQVASGPFMITEYKVGEFVKMEQNPYWKGPKPAVDEIVWRTFKNEDALSEALKQGEVDFAYFTSANIFNNVKDQPDIDSMVGTIPSFSEIGMNTGSAYEPKDDFFTPHGDGHPALTDPVVRRAIRMAINSDELNQKVLLGYGVPGNTIVPPVSVEGARWDPTGTPDEIKWDIAGANQLLDDAGYKDTDGDGVREMPAGSLDPGRPLEFRYYTRTSEQSSIDASKFVSEWLSQIGIKTDVEAVTSGKLGDIINEGTYDLFSWGWIPDPDPDSALSWFTCDQRPPDGSSYGNNDSYYCNPKYDQLYAQQRLELDPTKRWDIVHEMQKIYYEDSPYAIMWYDPVFSAWRTDRFTGYRPQPTPNGDPLEGWGGVSQVWYELRPVSASSGSSSETTGISSAIWLVIAGAVIIIGAIFVARARGKRSSEDEA